MTAARLNYEATCRKLYEMELLEDELGLLGEGPCPPMPSQIPRYGDDDPLGIYFSRVGFSEFTDLSGLTLSRTFFNKCRLENVTFENTDLSESNFRYNDFIGISFADADLSRSDLRCSIFEDVSFERTELSGADLRGSHFERCKFAGAKLDGTLLMPGQSEALGLTVNQQQQVSVTDDPDPDPGGG